ncbi:MAG: hypothetical protein JO166_02055 [Deltaproteobacteria bacterium]|nr:hypothetical protein [Deltaproteobacteria bacterium]
MMTGQALTDVFFAAQRALDLQEVMMQRGPTFLQFVLYASEEMLHNRFP